MSVIRGIFQTKMADVHQNDKQFMGESRFIPIPNGSDVNKHLRAVINKKFPGHVIIVTTDSTKPFVKDRVKTLTSLRNGGFLVVNIGTTHNLAKQLIDVMGLYYYGMIGYGSEDTPRVNASVLMVWRKSTNAPSDLYNPPVRVVEEKLEDRSFSIVREDYLIGGSKQRAIIPLLESAKYKNKQKIGYAGPVFGYAQIALAYACRMLGKKAVLFVEKRPELHPFTAFAKYMGAEIVEVESRGRKNTPLKAVQARAKQVSSRKNITLLPFGLHDAMYEKIFVSQLLNATKKMEHPVRMWLVAGSAVILNTLAEIFPDTYFLVVQVGKTVWPDQLPEGRSKLFVAPEKFWEDSEEPPPYASVSNYDAKLWQFVLQHGQDGDFIWNVGKDL